MKGMMASSPMYFMATPASRAGCYSVIDGARLVPKWSFAWRAAASCAC
jgi:hypothetical protein